MGILWLGVHAVIACCPSVSKATRVLSAAAVQTPVSTTLSRCGNAQSHAVGLKIVSLRSIHLSDTQTISTETCHDECSSQMSICQGDQQCDQFYQDGNVNISTVQRGYLSLLDWSCCEGCSTNSTELLEGNSQLRSKSPGQTHRITDHDAGINRPACYNECLSELEACVVNPECYFSVIRLYNRLSPSEQLFETNSSEARSLLETFHACEFECACGDNSTVQDHRCPKQDDDNDDGSDCPFDMDNNPCLQRDICGTTNDTFISEECCAFVDVYCALIDDDPGCMQPIPGCDQYQLPDDFTCSLGHRGPDCCDLVEPLCAEGQDNQTCNLLQECDRCPFNQPENPCEQPVCLGTNRTFVSDECCSFFGAYCELVPFDEGCINPPSYQTSVCGARLFDHPCQSGHSGTACCDYVASFCQNVSSCNIAIDCGSGSEQDDSGSSEGSCVY